MLYVDRKKSNISLAINKIYWVSIYWQMQLFYLEWEVFWHCYNNYTETIEETRNDTSKIVSVLKFVVSFLKYLENRIFSSSVILNVHAIGEKSSQLIFVTRSRKKQFYGVTEYISTVLILIHSSPSYYYVKVVKQSREMKA